MTIQPVNHLSIVPSAAPARRSPPPAAKAGTEDKVQLSEGAQIHVLFQQVEAEDETQRAEQVAQIRAQLNSGEYRPNLDIVAERLLAEFSPEAA